MIPASFQIRDLTIRPAAVLAPMAGVTDTLFRRVIRGLGLGLDEKAIEAVRQWTFQPALKDGRPVDVQITVEVQFRLY